MLSPVCFVGISTAVAKPCLGSGLCSPWFYNETSGFPRLSDFHFMKFYYRAGPSQASHYSINTEGTSSKIFLQKSRGSPSDKDFAAEKWYCKGGPLAFGGKCGRGEFGGYLSVGNGA